jgi:hypothetical protein
LKQNKIKFKIFQKRCSTVFSNTPLIRDEIGRIESLKAQLRAKISKSETYDHYIRHMEVQGFN